MMWALLTAIGLVTALWLRWRHKHKHMLKAALAYPGPPTLPGLGNALQFICNPEELVQRVGEMMKYGDYVRFWLGPDLNFIVSNPDEYKGLLLNPKITYKGPQYKYMADILGGGILSGSGPSWRKHRKIASPNYGKRVIENYSNIFNQEVDLLLEKFRKFLPNTQFDMYEIIVQHTSYAVCRTLMGLTKDQTMALPNFQEVIELSPKHYDIVFDRMTKWYLQIDPVFWMTNYYQEQKYFVKKFTELTSAIITHRKNHLKTISDIHKEDLMKSVEDTQLSVVDRFILSNELDDDELEKETFTIFTASQEASAKIASYLLLMMAYHPECQKKLYEEIVNVLGDEDRYVTDDDLKRMTYLDMAFKEVVRLFPIGAMLQRSVVDDVKTSKGILPAGCSLVIPIYHIQRDPRFWKNPEAFDPERFTPENSKDRHPNCYIPFSLGPMDCLGRFFGTKLVKTICVRVLREFELSSTNKYENLRLMIAISAVSIDGYYAMAKRRKQKQ